VLRVGGGWRELVVHGDVQRTGGRAGGRVIWCGALLSRWVYDMTSVARARVSPGLHAGLPPAACANYGKLLLAKCAIHTLLYV